jgi:hypothetical protein
MDCPQCGAKVPSEDAFCGKCGYAMRNHGPERLDQSRIRVHEEPDSAANELAGRSLSHQRIRKHTMVGMPSASPPQAESTGKPPQPSAPTPLASARSGRADRRVSQKTILGIPRPELHESGSAAEGAPPTAGGIPGEQPTQGHRQRVRVRYDSVNEPLSVTRRRQKALRALALLVVLAAAWLGYRFLTVNG